MFLLHKGIGPKMVFHHLGHLERFDPEQIKPLVMKLRSGMISESEKELLIKLHLRVVINIAGKYANVFRSKEDDIVSEAILALVETVENPKLIDDGFTPYVIVKVHSRIARFLSLEKAKRTEQLSDTNKKQIRLFKEHERVKEMKDILKRATTTKMQAKIIELREKAYKDKEIAKKLGQSVSQINKHRNIIAKRFEELDK